MFAEQQTEWIINNNLVNKGWHIDSESRRKNVFFQIPPYAEQQERLNGKRPDYILYQSGTSKPIAVIEAKKSGANLAVALEQATNYAKILKAPLAFAMNGAYCETRFIPNNRELFLNGEEVTELIREKEALKFLSENTNEVWTIPKEIKISREELIKCFRELNNDLRGEGLRAGIERFSEFSNILFLKLLSEETNKPWWKKIKEQPTEYLIEFINSYVISQIKKEYGGDVFTTISIKNPKTLRHIIDVIDPLVLSTIDTDVKGDAFEYFLEKTTSTENDLGEYFTPRNIVKTIIHLVNPKFKETIYDPFCGTGGFLTEAFNYVKENTIIESLEDITRLKHDTFYGREITTTARIAKMNMILHGDGHSGIQQINTLENPDYITGKGEEKKFDVVVTNIPFSQKIVKTFTKGNKEIKTNEISPLYYNGIAKNNGDATCVLHCLKSLKEGGRMALVVPEGFLFRRDIANVRKFLLSKSKLQCVISLPEGTFLPYTGVKTDILYFTDAHKVSSKDSYWFFEAKNIGVSLDNHKKKLAGNNDLKIIESSDIKLITKEKDFKHNMLDIGFEVIDLKLVKNNYFNLLGNFYRQRKYNTEYKLLKIEDICFFLKKHNRLAAYGKNSGNYPFFRSSQIVDKFVEKPDYEEECLIIGTGGRSSIHYSSAFSCSNDNVVFSVKNKQNILNKFIYYFLKNNFHLIEEGLHGAGLKHISKEYIKSIQIPVPSIIEQRKIVKELDRYQDKINKAIEAQNIAVKEYSQKSKDLITKLLKN